MHCCLLPTERLPPSRSPLVRLVRSPCLAITKDDQLLVAGALQPNYLLLLEASTLALLRAVPMESDVMSLAVGPARTLFMATDDGTILSMPLAPPGTAAGTGTAVITVAHTPMAHKAAIGTLVLSRNGKHVLTGGNDKLIKLWPEEGIRAGAGERGGNPAAPIGANRPKHWPAPCQPYAGHSDHVSKLVFSADGATLVSVGGGDAIYIWDFKGPAGVDEAEMVEESVRQAEAERAERMAMRERADERQSELYPTPAMVMQAGLAGAAEERKQASKSGNGSNLVASPANVEALRHRLRAIDTAEAGYMMAGVEAAMQASSKGRPAGGGGGGEEEETELAGLMARAGLEAVAEDGEEDDDEEDEEDDAPTPSGTAGPRKRFIGRVMYGDDAGDAETAAAGAALEAAARDAPAHDVADLDADADADADADVMSGLAPACARRLQLRRIIGLSTHAHDHVHWEPSSGVVVHATGDTLVVDRLYSPGPPAYLMGGTGEIATLALSSDGRFAAVGSGGDSPICVYDLAGRAEGDDDDDDDSSSHVAVLRMRLPGHVGGVQCLAFLGNAALASLGLSDGALRVHSIATGVPLLTCATPPAMACLAVSSDGMEISCGGASGLFTWRVSTQTTDAGTRAVLMPMPTRLHPPAPEEGIEPSSTQITSLIHISPALTLAGDSSGLLTLWTPAGVGVEPLAAFDLSSVFTEIDCLHATAVPPPGGSGPMGGGGGSASPAADAAEHESTSWTIIVAGVASAAMAAGGQPLVCRYELDLPSMRASAAYGDGGEEEDDEIEVTLLPVGEVAVDGDVTSMSFDARGEQGVIATDCGSMWHVNWTDDATATLMSGAIPPPLAALAVPRCSHPHVLASLCAGSLQGEECGVLLWDHQTADGAAPCAAPLARIYQPKEPASCVAISPPEVEPGEEGGADGAAGLCAVGYTTGRVQIICVGGLRLLKERRVHVSSVVCMEFGPSSTLLTAAIDGEVRLHVASVGQLLVPLATLRQPSNVRVTCLDVFFGDAERAPHWAIASEHQQIQVWPLVAKTDASVEPTISITLETQPLLTLPSKLQPLGWKCLVAFCPHRPDVVAACGLTRQRKLMLFDYVRYAPLAVFPLDEWPTSLAACTAAPLLAVGGASGTVRLIEYLAEPEEEADRALERAAIAAAEDVNGVMIRSAAGAELHCHNVRSLRFAGSSLISAADDEVATWQLPLA